MNIVAKGNRRSGSQANGLDKIPSFELLTHYVSPRESLGIDKIIVEFKLVIWKKTLG
jgi:hypothetical protein